MKKMNKMKIRHPNLIPRSPIILLLCLSIISMQSAQAQSVFARLKNHLSSATQDRASTQETAKTPLPANSNNSNVTAQAATPAAKTLSDPNSELAAQQLTHRAVDFPGAFKDQDSASVTSVDTSVSDHDNLKATNTPDLTSIAKDAALVTGTTNIPTVNSVVASENTGEIAPTITTSPNLDSVANTNINNTPILNNPSPVNQGNTAAVVAPTQDLANQSELTQSASNTKANSSDINPQALQIIQKTVQNAIGHEVSNLTPTKNGAININFADNDQLTVELSVRDVNRLFVEDDKITNLNAPQGVYEAHNDPSGSVYLSLLARNPFVMFITTQAGQHFSLFVIPKTMPGRTYEFKSNSAKPAVSNWEAQSPYQGLLVELTKGLINGQAPEGYAFVDLSKMKPINFYDVATLYPLAEMAGAHVSGVVYRIQNKGYSPLTLSESQFYKVGVRAVALTEQTLLPHGNGFVYEIISNDIK